MANRSLLLYPLNMLAGFTCIYVGAGHMYGGTLGSDGVLLMKITSTSQPWEAESLQVCPLEAAT